MSQQTCTHSLGIRTTYQYSTLLGDDCMCITWSGLFHSKRELKLGSSRVSRFIRRCWWSALSRAAGRTGAVRRWTSCWWHTHSTITYYLYTRSGACWRPATHWYRLTASWDYRHRLIISLVMRSMLLLLLKMFKKSLLVLYSSQPEQADVWYMQQSHYKLFRSISPVHEKPI